MAPDRGGTSSSGVISGNWGSAAEAPELGPAMLMSDAR
jgi:hypothetical protein